MQTFEARTIQFRLVTPEDTEFIHSLRVDPRKNQHLSPTTGGVEVQRTWLESYKRREADEAEFYYVIETNDRASCGVVRLYDFQGPCFCWGSWILGGRAPRKAAIESAMLVYEIGFGPLGFTKSHFDVRRANERVWKFHERMGATRVCETDLDYFYRYPCADYSRVRPGLEEFLGNKGPLFDGQQINRD